MPPIQPCRADVRPRVLVVDSFVPRLLEEEIAALLATGTRAAIRIAGAARSGKSTAVAHLAALFAGEQRLALADDEPAPSGDFLITVTTAIVDGAERDGDVQVWRLAPWTDDDCLEYLSTRHRDRAGRAFSAWRATPADHDLRRHPRLCTEVLDQLSSEEAAGDGLQALVALQRTRLGASLRPLQDLALDTFRRLDTYRRDQPSEQPEAVASMAPAADDWLRNDSSRSLLAAQRLLDIAISRAAFALESLRWKRNLAVAIQVLLQHDDHLVRQLTTALPEQPGAQDRLSLSLLAIGQPGFRPLAERLVDGAQALLAFTDLGGKTLSGNWDGAHLFEANLHHANLDECSLRAAVLSQATLTQATLRRVEANSCNAAGVRAQEADFSHATLRRACFNGAQLQRATLRGACLDGCSLKATDLSEADLSEARLHRVDLRTAQLAGARLTGAHCHRADASDTRWPGLQAEGSRWPMANLTGARWPFARLRHASFLGARLADVDWSGADLRHADLRYAQFHVGNARSGLVDSPLASEGTRTGFYTDESLEQHFQDPEVVRVANLTGCDLRGARLQNADLYLVDLRGAKLDPEQLAYARRCRALLDRQPAAE